MELALTCLGALGLACLLGAPDRWHPLRGFAWLARRADDLCYGPARLPGWLRRALGAVVLLALLGPAMLLAWGLSILPYVGTAVDMGLLWLALGLSGLLHRTGAVARALQDDDLGQARERAAELVCRDTADMDEAETSLATVEAVLRQGCEVVFGPLFWYAAAGAPGVVAYRLANALGALWGHPTPRYHDFGWAAACLARLVNWAPARLTALSYTLLGDRRAAWRCWRTQASDWGRPNAGTVLAAGAGALGLQLGGAVRYYGRVVDRPALGEGLIPRAGDIGRALDLVGRVLGLWVAVLIAAAGLWA